MKTPAGKECPYFYGNYFRGRKQEECRLIGNQPSPSHWSPDLCKTCSVPGIVLANACPHMQLQAKVQSFLFGLIRRVKVLAYCEKSHSIVEEPQIGCGQCHPFPPFIPKE